MMKPLTESVLCRLASEGMVCVFGQAERFEAALHPGCSLIFSNEPVADLNCVVAGRGATDGGHFADACAMCVSRQLPFLAVIFPEAGHRAESIAAEHGLVHVVDFPFMVRDDEPIEPAGNEAVVVRRAAGVKDAEASARVLSSAFSMPEASARRAMPASLMESPNVDVFLATIGGITVGSVTVTYHGDAAGIWAMGTNSAQQRGGIGRRLLSSAMAEARRLGARRFFLGATPAGKRLYEILGYTTRVVTTVWASGETHQA